MAFNNAQTASERVLQRNAWAAETMKQQGIFGKVFTWCRVGTANTLDKFSSFFGDERTAAVQGALNGLFISAFLSIVGLALFFGSNGVLTPIVPISIALGTAVITAYKASDAHKRSLSSDFRSTGSGWADRIAGVDSETRERAGGRAAEPAAAATTAAASLAAARANTSAALGAENKAADRRSDFWNDYMQGRQSAELAAAGKGK